MIYMYTYTCLHNLTFNHAQNRVLMEPCALHFRCECMTFMVVFNAETSSSKTLASYRPLAGACVTSTLQRTMQPTGYKAAIMYAAVITCIIQSCAAIAVYSDSLWVMCRGSLGGLPHASAVQGPLKGARTGGIEPPSGAPALSQGCFFDDTLDDTLGFPCGAVSSGEEIYS
jgi:hypothetical protein